MTELAKDKLSHRLVYTVAETAEALACGEGLVWELIRNGELKVIRRGPRYTRVVVESVREWVDATHKSTHNLPTNSNELRQRHEKASEGDSRGHPIELIDIIHQINCVPKHLLK